MTTTSLTIPGVAGTITVEQSPWSGYRILVDGVRIKPRGFPRNRLTLPGVDGPVEARVKGGALRVHPIIVIDGVEHPTGPPTPRVLQVLVAAPVVGIILIQGVIGFLLAFGGVYLNQAIVRSDRPHGTKVALTSLTVVAVLAIEIALIVAVLAAS